MACTTILVGKNVTYDGSTMVARNEDSPAGRFTPKNFVVIHKDEQPRKYKSVLSNFEIDLPDNPMTYTAMPDAVNKYGIWAAYGVNEANVSMNGTETITGNDRLVSSDPMVADGISEEDIVTITLPYIKSAREGVYRLGEILEKYGTYEKNGIAFQDENEIWWLETVGGHNFVARRVPDDAYVVMPNQFGIDEFDLEDAYGEQKNHICSKGLKKLIEENNLDISLNGKFNARLAFGTNSDSDHVYNTPRAWIVQKYFNLSDYSYIPSSDNIPWCRVPERKITVSDVKYVLSNHYQGTPYDPYSKHSDPLFKKSFRPIGVNRTNVLAMVQIRNNVADELKCLQWMALGSNVYNTIIPFYAKVSKTPEYLSNATNEVDTNNLYWQSRLIAALSDTHYSSTYSFVERYQRKTLEKTYEIIKKYDKVYTEKKDIKLLEEANEKIANTVKEKTKELLSTVLFTASSNMKNAFSKEDI